MKGKVKWYNIKKGYGFIEGENGNDYFVHYTQFPRDAILKEDDIVKFKEKKTEKGNQAIDVQIV